MHKINISSNAEHPNFRCCTISYLSDLDIHLAAGILKYPKILSGGRNPCSAALHTWILIGIFEYPRISPGGRYGGEYPNIPAAEQALKISHSPA